MIRSNTKSISILGCGWYGLELAKNLASIGYLVKGSTTSEEKFAELAEVGVLPYLIRFEEHQEVFTTEFFASPVLLICIPPKRSAGEQHVYLTKIKGIIRQAISASVEQIIFISSTSVYGDRNTIVDENTLPTPDTDSGKAILSVEDFLRAHPDFTSTIIRFGGLIGPNRAPGRFFAGKTDLPNGEAPVNLIHLQDCVGITLSILDQKAFGHTYNACSPDHPKKAEFYAAASAAAQLPPPVFRKELLAWKIVNSVAIPQQLGYKFQMPLCAARAQ